MLANVLCRTQSALYFLLLEALRCFYYSFLLYCIIDIYSLLNVQASISTRTCWENFIHVLLHWYSQTVIPLDSFCRWCAIIATTESHRAPRGWGHGDAEQWCAPFLFSATVAVAKVTSLNVCLVALKHGFWALAVKARWHRSPCHQVTLW